MTKEEAIAYANRVIEIGLNDETQAFCEIAIKALEKEPCGDCIGRQATVEFLEKHSETYEDVRVKMGFKASASLINNRNNLPPVTPTQNWIPTSERNPKLIKRLYADGEVTFTYYQSDRVLLQTKSDMLIGTYYKDAAISPHYETDDGYIIASRVIAWQPLPEEYKEG